MPLSPAKHLRSRLALGLTLALLQACGAPADPLTPEVPPPRDTTPAPPPPPPPTARLDTLRLDPRPPEGVLRPGGHVELSVVILGPSAFSGAAVLSISGADSTVRGPQVTVTVRGGVAIATLDVFATVDAQPGDVPISITVSGTGLATVTRQASVRVAPLGTFSVGGLPAVLAPSLAPGGYYQRLVFLTRDGYDAPVSLTAERVPTGFTVRIPVPLVTGRLTEIEVEIAPNLPAGVYSFDIRGQAAGRDAQVATWFVNVLPDVGGYEIEPVATQVIARGSVLRSTLPVRFDERARYGIRFEVEELPPGVLVDVSPALARAGPDLLPVLTVRADQTAPVGPVSVRVRAISGFFRDRTFDVPVLVQPVTPAGPTAEIDLRACGSTGTTWLAVQAGTGAWTRVQGTGGIFRFPADSARIGLAYERIVASSQEGRFAVLYTTRAELQQAPLVDCLLPGLFKAEARVPLLGAISPRDHVVITWGRSPVPNRSFYGGGTLGHPIDRSPLVSTRGSGPRDLVVWRSPSRGAISGVVNPHRGVLIRQANVLANGLLPTIDLDGPDSFAPATGRIVVAGPARVGTLSMNFHALPGCAGAQLYLGSPEAGSTAGGQGDVFGVPTDRLRENDLHSLVVDLFQGDVIGGEPQFQWTVEEFFRTMSDRTIAAPSVLTVQNPMQLPGNHFRFAVELGVPSTFNRSTRILVNGVRVDVSPGWLAGRSLAHVEVPDLSMVSGWTSSLIPELGSRRDFVVSAEGDNSVSRDVCTEGTRRITALVRGRF